jgi:hypothetical protein
MRTAYQEEHKANKTYRQLALPAVTISNLQRREAPLSIAITVNIGPEKAGVGASAPSLATMFSSSCRTILKLPLDSINLVATSRLPVTRRTLPFGAISKYRVQKSTSQMTILGRPQLKGT